ncbi:3-oxoacyl-[acyl-carrier-protein] synthase-3 [Aurantimicrobium minutum]|uniref:beta-ketoacyl-ACP synthase III n=1 Tax=Aurantimicrobium minutum TaxID=708131 RepID=UPI002405047C|nr:beta-ketoacyl-ACP synthase III [Aurantimicrobium minutum]MDF9809182.1 3-oxoacyl-[acyl-carrier-protein] synthase-3 [Aurantimicrobium minutum]
MNDITAVISGIGGFVPSRIITNHDLSRHLDTSDEWIQSKTGIRQRHVVNEQETTGNLAVEAGKNALNSAEGADIDLLILATTTPDYTCPATAPWVANQLNLGNIPAFDISAVCSGFIYAVSIATAYIKANLYHTVLVIAAESFTRIVDKNDRTTSPIFGDGAGAVVLRRGTKDELGAIHEIEVKSDGNRWDLITTADFNFTPEREGLIKMQGKATYIQAIKNMEQVSRSVLSSSGWDASCIDYVVGHQANSRILESLADKLALGHEKLIINIDHLGNTSAASIPLALTFGAVSCKFKAGDKILAPAFGAGATWGALSFTWPELEITPYSDPAINKT